MIYDGYDFGGLLTVETPIVRSLLAPVSVETGSAPTAGEVFRSASLGSLSIKVPVRLIASAEGGSFQQNASFERLRREVAGRLYRERPCKLVLDDAPDLYYMAMLEGSTDIDRFLWTGGATLSFVSPAPYGHGDRGARSGSAGSTVTVSVGGTYKTAPIVTVRTDSTAQFDVTFDGVPFTVGNGVAGPDPIVIDATRGARSVKRGDVRVAYDIMSDLPEWEPGVHTVSAPYPFDVEWEELWL